MNDLTFSYETTYKDITLTGLGEGVEDVRIPADQLYVLWRKALGASQSDVLTAYNTFAQLVSEEFSVPIPNYFITTQIVDAAMAEFKEVKKNWSELPDIAEPDLPEHLLTTEHQE